MELLIFVVALAVSFVFMGLSLKLGVFAVISIAYNLFLASMLVSGGLTDQIGYLANGTAMSVSYDISMPLMMVALLSAFNVVYIIRKLRV